MQTSQPQPSVFARDHTLLGVCEALGEDFGFNPIFLRVPLAVCLLLNPWAVVATYAGLGILVAFTRLVAPVPRQAAVAEAPAPAEADRAEAPAESDMAMAA
ncbi:MAG TPA: PspC domain-containing protein [Allosphingosinicella sp.]|jgi:phage shock protein PspC (stress-responsive transcriptional regulator)|nr:PspC domain-containing protein [Allosphingosinicella sp.]